MISRSHTFGLSATAAVAISLIGCSDPVADAKKRFEMVKHSSASATEICAAAKAIPAAHLARGEHQAYREALVHADGACLGAQLEDQGGFARDLNGNIYMPDGTDDMSVPLTAEDRELINSIEQ